MGGGGQEFYTGSRSPTSLIVERALSPKSRFIETSFVVVSKQIMLYNFAFIGHFCSSG